MPLSPPHREHFVEIEICVWVAQEYEWNWCERIWFAAAAAAFESRMVFPCEEQTNERIPFATLPFDPLVRVSVWICV